MMNSPSAQRWAQTAVALLTGVWVLAVLISVWRCFALGMTGWAEAQSDDGVRSAALDHQFAAAAIVLAGVAVGGPALIATVAFVGRMAWIGADFLVLAVVLGVLVLVIAASVGRTRTPSPPPQPAPTVCQEHSGGDTRCPGG